MISKLLTILALALIFLPQFSLARENTNVIEKYSLMKLTDFESDINLKQSDSFTSTVSSNISSGSKIIIKSVMPMLCQNCYEVQNTLLKLSEEYDDLGFSITFLPIAYINLGHKEYLSKCYHKILNDKYDSLSVASSGKRVKLLSSNDPLVSYDLYTEIPNCGKDINYVIHDTRTGNIENYFGSTISYIYDIETNIYYILKDESNIKEYKSRIDHLLKLKEKPISSDYTAGIGFNIEAKYNLAEHYESKKLNDLLQPRVCARVSKYKSQPNYERILERISNRFSFSCK